MAASEQRTARLTVLIDPRKKTAFERVCAAEDVTPSQVVRRLIREYVEAHTGTDWRDAPLPGRSAQRGGRSGARR